jgi:FdhD protein
MMATPADLEDFAIGFSLTDRVIGHAEEIEELTCIVEPRGIALAMTIAPERMSALWERRRLLAGPSGCGLCGIESIAEAVRPCPPVEGTLTIAATEISAAIAALPTYQSLNRETRAVHAAAFWKVGSGLVAVREDIGRHNALDKLAGAMARASVPAAEGVVLLTSRVSVEMVQKSAVIGAPIIAAVSAPSALAVRTAENCGITVVAVARGDGFEVFSHPGRIRS